MNRVKIAGEALVEILQELVPAANVMRSYIPNRAAADISLTPMIFVTPEDVATEITNHNGEKFTDRVTFTICLTQKVADLTNPTNEADNLVEILQNIRDYFRLKTFYSSGLKIITPSAEHSTSRPLYNRKFLEDGNVFVGLLFLEVQIKGIKNDG